MGECVHTAMGQDQMSQERCAEPACTEDHAGPLHLHPNCHHGVGVQMIYCKGVLLATCAECDAYVAAFAVAEESVPFDGHNFQGAIG